LISIEFGTEARDDHMHGLTSMIYSNNKMNFCFLNDTLDEEIDDLILPHVPHHFDLQKFVDFLIFMLLCVVIYYCWSVLPVGLFLYIVGLLQNPRTTIIYQTLWDMNHDAQAEEQHDNVIDQLIDPPTDNLLIRDSIEPDDGTRIRLNNEDDQGKIQFIKKKLCSNFYL